MRKFVAVDAAFSKTAFDYVVVLATGLDGEGRIVVLAWGIMPRETKVNWSWFLHNLKDSLEGLDGSLTVIISDRQKVRQQTLLRLRRRSS
jgi:hypothetical protein